MVARSASQRGVAASCPNRLFGQVSSRAATATRCSTSSGRASSGIPGTPISTRSSSASSDAASSQAPRDTSRLDEHTHRGAGRRPAVSATSVIRAARGDVGRGERGDASDRVRRGGVMFRCVPPGGACHDRKTAQATASPGAPIPCQGVDACHGVDAAGPARHRRRGAAARKRAVAPPAWRPQPFRQAPAADRPRPRAPGPPRRSAALLGEHAGRCVPRDRAALAPRGLPALLATAIAATIRPEAEGARRDDRADPGDSSRESAVGRGPDPRRSAVPISSPSATVKCRDTSGTAAAVAATSRSSMGTPPRRGFAAACQSGCAAAGLPTSQSPAAGLRGATA